MAREGNLTSPSSDRARDSAESAAAPALPYLSGLDGLRALAVIGVLLYHADIRWAGGGFLGVEVFFAISGYVITSLLLTEWQSRRHIDLAGFWLRRSRRLLPALLLVLGAVLAFAVVFLADEVASLRDDAGASLGYFMNWHLIFSEQSYFESLGRPPLLRHLWSLAIEGQFYVVWPVVFIAAMRFLGPRRLALIAIAGAVASTLLMAALYQPDADPSRIYYGTDTRAAGFLIGAALAILWAPWRSTAASFRIGRNVLDAAAIGAIGAIVLCFLCVNEYHPLLYRGGFAFVSLATAVAIGASVHPEARIGKRLLSLTALRWVGLRSYGIYLWHWPVFMVTRPQLDINIEGPALFALRIAITLTVAALSYRFVETPIRRGALTHAWDGMLTACGPMRLRLAATLSAFTVAATVPTLALGVAVVSAEPAAPPPYLAAESVHVVFAPAADSPAKDAVIRLGMMIMEEAPMPDGIDGISGFPPWNSPPDSIPGLDSEADATLELALAGFALSAGPTNGAAAPPPREQPPDLVPVLAPDVLATAIGDSVMLGAVNYLGAAIGSVEVDAAVGRQVSTSIEILRAKRDAGQLGEIVIVHVGNNGTFSGRQFDELMEVLSGARKVVLVNLHVPRNWERPNNEVIAEGVKRYPNAVLVDWQSDASRHAEYFWDDGIHLRPEGARAYASLIAAGIKD